MSKSRVLLCLLVNFIGGVFVRSFWEIEQSSYYFVFIFSLGILFIFYKNKLAAVAAFILIFFIFGAYITDSSLRKVQLAEYAGKIFQEKALVEKVSSTSLGQNLIIELQKSKIQMLLKVPQYPAFNYGDLLEINCQAQIIQNIDASFDYRMYMAKDGVLYSCENKKYLLIARNRGNILLQTIFKLRNYFEQNISGVIPQPEGALAIGLILGGSGGLSKELQTDFSRTGMTHIVAVSGYNVTIIAEYLIMLGIWLGLWRKQATWFAIAGIILFVTASGLPASAVRAGVMGSILLWALKHGRITNAENGIIFAASIMLILNPLLLRYDVGFQLSFLATLGIVLTSPFWEKSFIKKHQALGITEAIALSLSAQIFVLPIIAYNFHLTSLVSLLANIFILPIVPFSMLMVFLVALAGFVFSPLSLVLGWLAYLPLHYEIWLIHTLSNFPWASTEVHTFNSWIMALYYFVIICFVYWLKASQKFSAFNVSNERFGRDLMNERVKRGK